MITKTGFITAILPFTLSYEGGYANVTGDRGGETYRGISRVNNPYWSGWAAIDKLKPLKHNTIISALENSVRDFYFTSYFKNYGFDRLSHTKKALVLFDWTTHGGYAHSRIQDILNQQFGAKLSKTGRLDTATVAAINNAPEGKFVSAVVASRRAYLDRLIAADPSQGKFAKGWTNRLKALVSFKAVTIGVGFLFVIALIIFIWLRSKGAQA